MYQKYRKTQYTTASDHASNIIIMHIMHPYDILKYEAVQNLGRSTITIQGKK
jgi:hypothetical protein